MKVTSLCVNTEIAINKLWAQSETTPGSVQNYINFVNVLYLGISFDHQQQNEDFFLQKKSSCTYEAQLFLFSLKCFLDGIVS